MQRIVMALSLYVRTCRVAGFSNDVHSHCLDMCVCTHSIDANPTRESFLQFPMNFTKMPLPLPFERMAKTQSQTNNVKIQRVFISSYSWNGSLKSVQTDYLPANIASPAKLRTCNSVHCFCWIWISTDNAFFTIFNRPKHACVNVNYVLASCTLCDCIGAKYRHKSPKHFSISQDCLFFS